MVGDIITLLTGVITACVGWFDDALQAVGGVQLLIAVIFMALAYKYILGPILSGGSDKVSDKGKGGGA